MMQQRNRTTAPRPDGQQQTPPSPRMSARRWITLIGLVILFNFVFYYLQLGTTSTTPQTTLSYSAFVTQVQRHNIKNATISGTDASGNFRKPYKTGGKSYTRYTTTIVSDVISTLVPYLQKEGVDVTLQNNTTPIWLSLLGLLLQALPLLFLFGLFYFGARSTMQQQQGIFGFGQSRAKLYTEERPTTTFADVAGVDAAKAELREIVDFLREPEKYHRLGARIPKGVLLVGPPGTGKTLLARAIAGEARVAFFSISATEFVEMFVGVGASRVRDLFDRARAASPSIIFVDELDAIGGSRGRRGPVGGGGNDEREQTLNQLLVSMDGFEPTEAVIVLAATNRPDVLDPALLRPGRFDRQVTVDPPDRAGREAILAIHTRDIPLGPDVDLAAIARATPGMSGADLANLANEAALAAARKGETRVTRANFDEALDRITLGLEGAPLMNEDERRTVAYHEAGHAMVAYLMPGVDPVNRITITPRGRSLGVTQFLPTDERRNYRRDYLLSRMAVGLGGRASEEVVFDDITSGAQNDLQQVTNIARTMVTQLGMADELGPVYLGGAGDDALGGSSYNPWEPKEYSDETAHRIDAAVARLVDEAHRQALEGLRANRPALDAVAEALVHDESLDRDRFVAIARANGAQPLGGSPAREDTAPQQMATPVTPA
ncbi:MAG TPA: ATP-dependent zinc metalloprotease FtsH [Chloroflexota bacterium]|nr:ATP-dependent zinc metalloprotease FtsH [Chloroflexota bacterium]